MPAEALNRKALLADQLEKREVLRDEALKAAGISVWEFMPGEERVYFDELSLKHFGVVGEPGMYLYDDLIAKIHPDDQSLVEDALAAAMEDESILYDVVYRTRRPEGGWRWIRAVGRLGPARMAVGKMSLSGTTQDVTFQKESEAQLLAAHERISLMAGELNHRVKNLFSIMGYLITQSGRGAVTAGEAMQKARDRINALSRAHALSSGGGSNQSFGLRPLIQEILSPYPLAETQVNYQGPEVELSADKLTSLGIIFHELATNAVKYGALHDAGRGLDISWTLKNDVIQIIWTESGLKLSSETAQTGFGSKAIKLSAQQLSGTTSREFADNGMVFDLTFTA